MLGATEAIKLAIAFAMIVRGGEASKAPEGPMAHRMASQAPALVAIVADPILAPIWACAFPAPQACLGRDVVRASRQSEGWAQQREE